MDPSGVESIVNQEEAPVEDPCIIVDDYTVFIIGGRQSDGKIVTGTIYTTFDVLPDQVT